MERQTKHRILGVLVVIGLVVLTLPLLQSKTEVSHHAVRMNAPPFPEQSLSETQMIPTTTSIPKLNTREEEQPTQSILSLAHPSIVQAKKTEIEMKVTRAVWVIQVGSFKEKENALRIVNRLRSKGYHAFIKQFSTASGMHTRVLVGPEDKKIAAYTLAAQIKNEMHLQGVVINYKPLAL
jgi:DedD protein